MRNEEIEEAVIVEEDSVEQPLEEQPLEEKHLTEEEMINTYKQFVMDYVEKNPSATNTKAARKALGIILKPYVREGAKIQRNNLCPCGSAKKYKNCCLK